MTRAGRFTAALMLILLGAALLADQSAGTDYLSTFYSWWPVFLIALGVEFMLFTLWGQWKDKRVKLDSGTLIFSVMLAVIVMSVMNSGDWFRNWNVNFNFADGKLSSESGIRFERQVELELEGADHFRLENRYGNVDVRSGDVDQVEASMTVFVSNLEAEEAEKIFEEVRLESKLANGTLQAEVKSEAYRASGSKWRPKVNMTVTVPEDHRLGKLEVESTLGSLQAAALRSQDRLILKAFNGKVAFADIAGSVEAETVNGDIEGTDVDGDAEADAMNGKIRLTRVNGDVAAETVNGSITVEEVAGQLQMDTVNGTMTAASRTIGGDWELDGVNSSMELTLPALGDYRIVTEKRTTGDIPLEAKDGHKEATIGKGIYKVEIDSVHGSVTLRTAS